MMWFEVLLCLFISGKYSWSVNLFFEEEYICKAVYTFWGASVRLPGYVSRQQKPAMVNLVSMPGSPWCKAVYTEDRPETSQNEA